MNKKSIESFIQKKEEEVPVNFKQSVLLNKKLKKKLKDRKIKVKDFYNGAALAFLAED